MKPAGSAPRAPAAFEGELSFFSLPELIQLVCTGGHDSEIDIIADGVKTGNLIIRGGRVFRCSFAGQTGEPAFFQLARFRAGRFRVTPLPSEGAHDAGLLNYSWQELLLEAARREDEAKRGASGPSAPSREGKPPETQRSSRPSDGYIDLFNSTPPPPPPPPLPRSDVYGRVEERGQLIPFPRKPIEDPIEDTVVSSSDIGDEAISAPTPTPAPVASGRPVISPPATSVIPAWPPSTGAASAGAADRLGSASAGAAPPSAPAIPPPPLSLSLDDDWDAATPAPIAPTMPASSRTAPSAPIPSSRPGARGTTFSGPASPAAPMPRAPGSRPSLSPSFIPEPPRSRPGTLFDAAPDSQPPLSLQPPSMRSPDKAAGSPFAQLIQDATAAYLRRDYERALELFEECLRIDPSDRRVQHNIERIKNRRSRA